MTDLELLKKEIEARIPGVKAALEVPKNPRAGGFLDLSLNGRGVVVEWTPCSLFGISSDAPDPIPFEPPDEIYHDIPSATKRLIELLLGGQQTQARAELLLQNLRTKMGMSQVELATALRISQPTLSKIERRPDMLLSTIIKVVKGLGGMLEINARFPTGRVQIALINPTKPRPGKMPKRPARPPKRKSRQPSTG
jgi:DNA-binding XRE family transcriptional regulator